MFSKKANASFVVPYATNDIITNININLKIVIKVCNLEIAIFFIKSADTCAFKKKARGIARNATNAIPNSQLANDDVTIGSTAVALGATASTIAGLTSLASTTLIPSLFKAVTAGPFSTSMAIFFDLK